MADAITREAPNFYWSDLRGVPGEFTWGHDYRVLAQTIQYVHFIIASPAADISYTGVSKTTLTLLVAPSVSQSVLLNKTSPVA